MQTNNGVNFASVTFLPKIKNNSFNLAVTDNCNDRTTSTYDSGGKGRSDTAANTGINPPRNPDLGGGFADLL